jgi:DNA polymerase
MLRLDDFGWPVVMHVHDEAVVELKDVRTEWQGTNYELNTANLKQMHEIMTESPPWAKGLPIAVSGWWGYRYRK